MRTQYIFTFLLIFISLLLCFYISLDSLIPCLSVPTYLPQSLHFSFVISFLYYFFCRNIFWFPCTFSCILFFAFKRMMIDSGENCSSHSHYFLFFGFCFHYFRYSLIIVFCFQRDRVLPSWVKVRYLFITGFTTALNDVYQRNISL